MKVEMRAYNLSGEGMLKIEQSVEDANPMLCIV